MKNLKKWLALKGKVAYSFRRMKIVQKIIKRNGIGQKI